ASPRRKVLLHRFEAPTAPRPSSAVTLEPPLSNPQHIARFDESVLVYVFFFRRRGVEPLDREPGLAGPTREAAADGDRLDHPQAVHVGKLAGPRHFTDDVEGPHRDQLDAEPRRHEVALRFVLVAQQFLDLGDSFADDL